MTEQNTLSISELQQQANAGDTQAQFDLAYCYAEGKDIEKNLELSLMWLTKAAERGLADAQFVLGFSCFLLSGKLGYSNRSMSLSSSISFFPLTIVNYLKSLNVDTNKLAFLWLKKAAEQSCVEAQFLLAGCYFGGIGVEQNSELEMTWLIKAGEQGHQIALHKLAHYYLEDKNVIQDDRLAFEWFKKAANQNSAEAQYYLAICYLEGKGVDQNHRTALDWLVKRAENPDRPMRDQLNKDRIEACLLLGELYAQGRKGIVLNKKIASKWIAEGEASINSALSPFHYHKNKNESDEEYTKRQAEELKALWAEVRTNVNYYLAKSYLSSNLEEDVILGMQYMLKAVNAGKMVTEDWVEYLYQLALCYFEGRGVERDYPEGIRLLVNASAHGHVEAKNSLTNSYLAFFIPSCLTDREDGERYYKFAADWCFKEKDGQNAAGANLLLGILYRAGKGVEQNDEQALACLIKAQETVLYITYDYTFFHSLIDCYIESVGGESRWGWYENFIELAFLKNTIYPDTPEDRGLRIFIALLKSALYKAAGEYEAVRESINEAFDETLNRSDEKGYMDKNIRDILLKNLEQEQELIEKTKALESEVKQKEKLYKALQKKEQDLEDMMSMFAHKFRSPLDAIIYNTSHANNPKLYAEAAQTMRGLLDIFSIISTDDKILTEKIKADCQGNARLNTVLSKTLNMILLHLLSASGTEKIHQHYLAYAKAHEKITASVTDKEWYDEHFELEQALQAEWEQDFATLLSQSAPLTERLAWLEEHFFKLELIGFDREEIQFKEYAITESLLTILLNEILVNAFKYYSSEIRQAVVLEWSERDGKQFLSCRNPSVRRERTTIKGSGKGHTFLSALARKIGGQFTKPKPQDDFVLEFGIHNELLMANPTGGQ
ncbi:MAG: SEL1-like repeat protein [Methylovulum sp.]|nr:SEL1-like repeat protein [Methylovulum sp.]